MEVWGYGGDRGHWGGWRHWGLGAWGVGNMGLGDMGTPPPPKAWAVICGHPRKNRRQRTRDTPGDSVTPWGQ